MATPRSAPSRTSLAATPRPPAKTPVKNLVNARSKTAQGPTKAAGKVPHKAAPKPALPPAPATPAAKPALAAAAPRTPREKLVRDGFTFPANEYERIGAMKKRALALGGEAKKSEIVRAALNRLSALADADFITALAAVPRIKTGRRKKDKAV